MMNKEDQYKEIYLGEALESFEEINRLLTAFEKNTGERNVVNALFRITHTLKGNSSGMGYTGIAEMAHVLEDLFGEVRENRLAPDQQMFTSLFKAVDTLGELINAVKDGRDVKYKGIKTKLEVLVRRSKENSETLSDASTTAVVETDKDVIVTDVEANDEENETDNKLAFSDLVQVPVRKLDALLDLVGELIIEKDRLLTSTNAMAGRSLNDFARLSRISSILRDGRTPCAGWFSLQQVSSRSERCCSC
jgi:two-component system, chemotaxis family, sensor kinase CheA